MSSDIVVHTGSTPVAADGNHRYQDVQKKMKVLAQKMDEATTDLENLRQTMRANAATAQTLANQIENADLDVKFVALTQAVSAALDGASTAVGKLLASAQQAATRASDVQHRHRQLYQRLDEVRSGRAERTPKPGFFAH
ncbi:conjugal transfer protein TraB [Streptomyces sp. NPDC095602]|uniref:conjugal transfer protein TraB n=1 Tax=Streptomyces sp. NPDC095602 TaxID=3155819 RepID=UPI003329D49C